MASDAEVRDLVPAGTLVVHDLKLAELTWRDYAGVISIEDHETSLGLRIRASAPEQLVLRFDDLDFEDGVTRTATEDDVRQAIHFARRFRDLRLLVHCHMGQCRSPGVVLGIISDRIGQGGEDAAVRRLLEIRPVSAPNLLVLKHADRILERGGALEAAWLRHEDDDDRLGRIRALRRMAYDCFRSDLK